jgi:hypothetical protein
LGARAGREEQAVVAVRRAAIRWRCHADAIAVEVDDVHPASVRPFATLPEKVVADIVSRIAALHEDAVAAIGDGGVPRAVEPTLLPENVTPETLERAAPLPVLPETEVAVMLVPLNVPPESPRGLGRAAVPVAFVPILLSRCSRRCRSRC